MSDYLRLGSALAAFCFAAILALIGFILDFQVANAKSPPQIWLTIIEPVWRGLRGWPPSDFSALVHESEWPRVVSSADVFLFTEKYAAHGDPTELGPLIELLAKHDVKIGLQGIPVIATRQCGLGIESYGTATETTISGRRLQSLGAKVSYIVMDEPLFYGHWFKENSHGPGCKLSVEDLAKQVAERVADWNQAFPGVSIGDVEPLGVGLDPSSGWTATLAQWLDAYHRRSGQNLAFIQFDMLWKHNLWREQLKEAASLAQKQLIPFGVYYTGSISDHSDSEWSAEVAFNYDQVENELNIRPQQVVFASWTDYPRRVLPETNTSTFTGAALSYIQRRKR